MSLVALIVIWIMISGCIADADKKSNTTGSQTISNLIFGSATEVKDTNLNDVQYSKLSGALCFEGLVRLSPSGAHVPELAKSWQVSSDLKKWTFYLQDNATWSDGKPVTSADVKFTLENLAITPVRKIHTSNIIASVDAPDTHTVIINLNKSSSDLLSTIDVIKVLPEHIYKDIKDVNTFDSKEASIGSGPYMYDHFDKDAGLIVFVANENYWNGKPPIGTIEYKMYKSMDTVIQALLKGEIDVPASTINYYHVPEIVKNNDLEIMTAKNGGVSLAIYFNTAKAPYDEKKFREALSYAIDYEEMKNLFTAGYGSIPPAGWIPEGTYGYVETRPLEYSINKSKSLLDSIGMVDKDGDGLREMSDGKKFSAGIIVRSDMPDHIRAVEMLKKYLLAVGVDLKVNLADLATFNSLTGASQEIILSSISFVGISMGAGFGTGLVGMSGYSWCMVDDPAYTSLEDQLSMIADDGEKLKLGADLQRYYADNLPMITVYSMDQIQPYSKKYAGWIIGPASGVLNKETVMQLRPTLEGSF